MNKLWANITKIIWTQEGQIMLNQKVSNMHLCFNFSKLYWPNSSNFASNLIRLHSQNVIRQNNSQIEYLLRGKNTIWKEKVICFAWLLLFYWIQQEYLTERVPFDLLGCWQQENYLRRSLTARQWFTFTEKEDRSVPFVWCLTFWSQNWSHATIVKALLQRLTWRKYSLSDN